MRWLLNSAVIPAPGVYHYRLLDRAQATAWLRACILITAPSLSAAALDDADLLADDDPERGAIATTWVSRIGYPATADHIADLCGVRPEVSRGLSQMEPGDVALVVRLPYRVPDPTTKGIHVPQAWEYGLLQRTV